MTTLAINFAKRPRSFTLLGLCLCALGVSAAGLVAWNIADAQTELDQAQAKLARLQRTSTSTRRLATPPAAQKDEDKSLLRVTTQLRRPWSGLLGEIDLLSSPAVAVLSVESQGQTRALRLSGEAKSMANVVTYVNNLRQSPLIESAYLTQHEDKQTTGVNVIRFSLDATWRAPQ